MTNYYQILGLQPGASKTEIKKAYRRLAKLYHPDRNKSASARQMFIKVDKAYNALMSGKTSKQSTVRRTKRTKTPYEKWANVHDAPTNPRDYAEWVKVKKQQTKSPDTKEYHRKKFYKAKERQEAYEHALNMQIFVATVTILLTLLLLAGGFALLTYMFHELILGKWNMLLLIPVSAIPFYGVYRMIRFLIKDVFIKTM